MKYFYTIITLFIIYANVSAQELLTFDNAIELAMRQNHQIEIARNNAKTAQNNVHIGNAGLLPRIDLSGSAQYQNTTLPGSSEEATTSNSAQIQASYTLFDGFGNIYQFKKLQVEGTIGELQARELIEITLFNLSQAYYSAASASENLRIAQELLAISRERLERAKKRAIYGQAKTVDVLAAQVDFNSDSVSVVQAMLQWQESRRDLNVLLNREITHSFKIDDEVQFFTLEPVEALLKAAQNNNADYQATVQFVRQARMNLNIARSAYSPSLSMNASYGYSQMEPNFGVRLDDPTKSWKVSASLNFNIFNGFQTRINNQNAQINLKNQTLEEQQARLEIEKEVISSHEAYQNSRIVLDLEQQNLEAAEVNFRRTQELYNLGQVTTTQFREAQLNLVRAKYNISDAKYTAKLNEIALLKLTGQLVSE